MYLWPWHKRCKVGRARMCLLDCSLYVVFVDSSMGGDVALDWVAGVVQDQSDDAVA